MRRTVKRKTPRLKILLVIPILIVIWVVGFYVTQPSSIVDTSTGDLPGGQQSPGNDLEGGHEQQDGNEPGSADGQVPQVDPIVIRHAGIDSLADIGDLTYVRELDLRGNQLVDISALAEATYLESLDLRDNLIHDISPLAGLTNLRELNLRGNRIEDISALQHLTSLRELNLRENRIQSIDALSGMKQLRDVNLRHNYITNIQPLAGLSHVRDRLYLEGNPITDYRPVYGYYSEIADKDFTRSMPALSHPGGFYKQEFDLEIYAPADQTQIYYTLDGSEPDPLNNSRRTMVYSGPIPITDMHAVPNGISMIPTNEIVSDDISIRHWMPPQGLVPKATTVRVRSVTADNEYSPVLTQTYFVNQEYTFPVFSLTTNAENLFDHHSGMYVSGAYYNGEDHGTGNYHQRGVAWEKDLNVEYFAADGSPVFSQQAGVRIQGAFTRHFPQKSLRLYARDEYGISHFYHSFFEHKDMHHFKRLILRNSGNDWNFTMFRDAAMQSLVQHLDLDTQFVQPSIVFINGEYWGIHHIRDRLDQHYLETHYGADRDRFTILERHGQLDTGEPGDEQPYEELIRYVQANDLSQQHHYEHVQSMMDIDNYIQYYAIQIYSGNDDWPQNNISWWRYKLGEDETPPSAKLDGRWRWFIYDMDRSLGYAGVSLDMVEWVTTEIHQKFEQHWPNILFRELLKNTLFRNEFINTLADHLNSTFLPERVTHVIDGFQGIMEVEILEHLNRWPNLEMNSWYNQVQLLRTFAGARPNFVRQHVLNHFQLTGTANVQVLTDQERGYVKVNSLSIHASTPGITAPENWTGIYFKGVPIQIEAVAHEGYEFVGWAQGANSSSKQVTIELRDDIVLQPIFKERAP